MHGDYRIDIAQLVLRVPGVTSDEVPSLVDDVLHRVQDRLRGSKRCGEVHVAELTVRVPAGSGRDALVGALADAIEGALR